MAQQVPPGMYVASDGNLYPIQPTSPPAQPAQRQRLEYSTAVNKKSLNMTWFERTLNSKAVEAWRLAHVFEQDGNTVMVFDRPI